jgi:hypothetical protein
MYYTYYTCTMMHPGAHSVNFHTDRPNHYIIFIHLACNFKWNGLHEFNCTTLNDELMRNDSLAITIFMSVAILACGGSSEKKAPLENDANTAKIIDTETEVPFKEAKNYFVKNTFHEDQLQSPKIETQEKLEEIFGAAAVMGPNGMPTEIDFTKQYAIAVVGKVNDTATTYKVRSLVQKLGVIELDLAIESGTKQSYSTQPYILLIVDRKYEGDIEIISSK